MDNRNVTKASCLECPRNIEVTHELVCAVEWGQSLICKECGTSLEVAFGNLCRDHGEDLSKGYCNGCARAELMDNQL